MALLARKLTILVVTAVFCGTGFAQKPVMDLKVLFWARLGSLVGQEAQPGNGAVAQDAATRNGVLLFAYRAHGHVKYNKPEEFTSIVDDLTSFLKTNGVPVVNDLIHASVVTDQKTASNTLVTYLRQIGAQRLLFLTVDTPFTAKLELILQCYDSEGKLLWEEKVRENPLRESVAAGQATEELHTRLGYRVQELRDNSTPVVPPAVAQDAAKQHSQQPALAADTNSTMSQRDQSSQVIKLPPPGRIPNASWLQPSDPEIQAALDSGFNGSKLSYRVFTFNPQKSKVSWSQHEITLEPPLVCAFAYGQIARSKLVEKPEFSLVKTDCYGKIVVTAVHVSQSLGVNWPIVLERKGQRLQPNVTVPDPNPAVTRYSTFGGDVVGYQYQDRFAFLPPPDWTNDLDLTYADDSGKHHTVTVKTAMFEQR